MYVPYPYMSVISILEDENLRIVSLEVDQGFGVYGVLAYGTYSAVRQKLYMHTGVFQGTFPNGNPYHSVLSVPIWVN